MPAPAWGGSTCEALSHLGPTRLTTCLCVVAVVQDLLVASAGPLSRASFGCRLQGREEREEPPQQWGLGLFALCYHLGFDVLFWMREKTRVFQSVKNIQCLYSQHNRDRYRTVDSKDKGSPLPQ